jgi:hypothetical protein
MQELFDHLKEWYRENEKNNSLYLLTWLESNKDKLIHAEKEHIANAYETGYSDLEKKLNNTRFFGKNYVDENYK